MHAYIGVSYVYIPIAHYIYAYFYSLLSLPIVSLVCFAELGSLAPASPIAY